MSYRYRSNNRAQYNRNGRSGGNRSNRNANRGRGQYIDPKRFVQAATMGEQTEYQPQHQFADFSLEQILATNLASKDYITPSPIQDQTIPAALVGRDIIGIASTGTGKTAAFALPVLQKLITDKTSAALIVAPTRELAEQIRAEFRSFSKGTGLYDTLLIGGSSMGYQLRDLRRRPRIVIGTPGRIKDHIGRGTLKLQYFNMVVLDEVDRMLDMGFITDVTEILSNVSKQRQSFFFSATMDNKVRTLIDRFADDPLTISLRPSSTSENIHQDVVRYRGNIERLEKLHDILIQEEVSKAIVFNETQRSVEQLNKELISRGFSTEAIHGGKSQGQRKRALERFKQNQVNILIATDVAARGIDVSDVTHVINFTVPKVYDDYIHRIGRAGRAGQVGYALTFVTH